MVYTLPNGKQVKIPDSEIANNMKVLELTKEEAIQMWLEDEGYEENEEQEQLTQKAKENKITATIHDAQSDTAQKKGRKKGERKEDPDKEMIISELSGFLGNLVENVQVLNVGKLISFSFNGENYELDLKKKRKPKK